MQSVTYPTLQVLSNGEVTDTFQKAGELVKDALSLSIISCCSIYVCIERPGHTIGDLVAGGRWKPIKVGCRGPSVLHHVFVDDPLLLPKLQWNKWR